MNICTVQLAGLSFQIHLLFTETAAYFRDYFVNVTEDAFEIGLKREEIEEWRIRWHINNLSYLEYFLLMKDINVILMKHHRCIFHGVAFLMNGHAYILSGHSGVGKTTQYRHLKALYPQEISVINGDKPILECREHSVYVHPSPWQGKENYGALITGELKGIILLEQGSFNYIERTKRRDAVIPVFDAIQTFYENNDVIEGAALIATEIISAIPIWYFQNDGTPASSQMLYETMKLLER